MTSASSLSSPPPLLTRFLVYEDVLKLVRHQDNDDGEADDHGNDKGAEIFMNSCSNLFSEDDEDADADADAGTDDNYADTAAGYTADAEDADVA